MLIHSVYFWLKDDLSDDDKRTFRHALEALREIESALAVYVGTPSATSRPVVERTYTFGLTVLLKDLDAHDAYQADPIHTKFVNDFKGYWDRITVFDFE